MPQFCVKWAGNEYEIDGLQESHTVFDLKEAIAKETQVLPHRQKLLNLKCKGRPAPDATQLGQLDLKAGFKVMMVGSREETISSAIEKPSDLPVVEDDFDIKEEKIDVKDRQEFLCKVERRIREYKINQLNEPRKGKKLLVLDIDYTLFDHRSSAESGAELMRPYLHEFLTSAYEDYDIVIWSATSMKWVEEKMKLLKVSSNSSYKIVCFMDDLAMISVMSEKHGFVNVKPLGVIWGKYPQYKPSNTIILDDCSRNFLMNPQNGLKIPPFREAHLNRHKDRVLLHMSQYLKSIAKMDDFSSLDHSKWRKYL
ncbi:unnamed protein product [Darwinula stevensoni]|uniref:Ubiquitin-like domain-containing CTD phosphatase 1 n=1 Tax=Darwinula stevensoni TaxID=69355 RepID=A0A7R8XFE2_9CRUS|nr:unnamed protein product [Darwinula stevensoni]CAG0890514.1 unnamed protein product [Darwinula stevensoni]